MEHYIKKRWVEALRSGDYEQGKGYLQEEGFCCLGVLCDLHHNLTSEGEWDHEDLETAALYLVYGEDGEYEFPPDPVLKWSGLNRQLATDLASRNDAGATFEELADLIEEKA